MHRLDEDLREAIERARAATEQNQSRFGSRVPSDERRRRAEELAHERLPAYLAEGRLEGRIRDASLQGAVNWWNWERGSLIMLGPTGCGKSTAAGLIVRRLLDEACRAGGWDWQRACSTWWYSATALELARRHHPIGRGEAPEVTRACTGKLLVLDDLGWSPNDVQVVAYVLHERMERQLSTIVTSSLTKADLTARYGDAVIRRLLESGRRLPKVVECFEQDVDDVKMLAAGDR